MWMVLITTMACFALLNLSAYLHAYRMSHFVSSGTRTSDPELLSWRQKIKILVVGVTVPKPKGDQKPSDRQLDYRTVTMTTEEGLTLRGWHIRARESKGMMVIFHGYASCKAHLLMEAELFHQLGWEVLLVDFRGAGDSEGNITTLGVAEVNDVTTVMNWARQNGQERPVILFGRSMGAVAIMHAIDQGRVNPDAVILECPFDRMLNAVKNRFVVMGVPSFPCAHLLVFWGGVQHRFNAFRHNAVDYARSLTCPVLLLYGNHDPRVTPQEIDNIKQNLKTNCTFHTFNELAHESYCQAMPDEYRRVASRWLERFSRG